jgi:YD repeat-containing protein
VAGRVDAAGRTLRYQWDLLGRLTELQNENGGRYGFVYDPVGRVLEETGFDRRRTQYRHEQDTGRLAEVIDGERVMRLQSDAMGRLVERAVGEQVERFAFDRNGRMTEAVNADARLQWFHDPAGNLTREHQHDLSSGRTAVWQHRYDELNQRIATVRPDGHATQWLTYGSGHVHGLLLDGEDILGFERDDLHREVARAQGNGLSQRLRYDGAGRRLEQHIARTAGHTATPCRRALVAAHLHLRQDRAAGRHRRQPPRQHQLPLRPGGPARRGQQPLRARAVRLRSGRQHRR